MVKNNSWLFAGKKSSWLQIDKSKLVAINKKAKIVHSKEKMKKNFTVTNKKVKIVHMVICNKISFLFF